MLSTIVLMNWLKRVKKGFQTNCIKIRKVCNSKFYTAPFLLACEKGRINDVMKFIHIIAMHICVYMSNGSLSQIYLNELIF